MCVHFPLSLQDWAQGSLPPESLPELFLHGLCRGGSPGRPQAVLALPAVMGW